MKSEICNTNQTDLFSEFRELVIKQLKEAYIDGTHQGAISTCAVIYKTMKMAGLEEDNFLFHMLKDLAEKHGCKDIAATADQVGSKESLTSDEIQS